MYLRQLCCGFELERPKTMYLKNKTGMLLICPKCRSFWRMYTVQGKPNFEKLSAADVADAAAEKMKNIRFRGYLIQSGWRPKRSQSGELIWIHPEITECIGSRRYDLDSALTFQLMLDQALKALKLK